LTCGADHKLDDALVAKITSEIQVEQDGHPSATHLESYLKNSEYEVRPWLFENRGCANSQQLKDTSGEEEVVLTRSFGNEK
jgi:hypothetical protein